MIPTTKSKIPDNKSPNIDILWNRPRNPIIDSTIPTTAKQVPPSCIRYNTTQARMPIISPNIPRILPLGVAFDSLFSLFSTISHIAYVSIILSQI